MSFEYASEKEKLKESRLLNRVYSSTIARKGPEIDRRMYRDLVHIMEENTEKHTPGSFARQSLLFLGRLIVILS